MTAPDPAFVVQQQVFPPGPQPPDAITMYDGAIPAKNGFGPWKAWDLRGWLNRLVWDLLRFQTIDSGKPNADRTVPYGLRDTVSAIWYLTDQNNQLLKSIATKVGADMTHLVMTQKDVQEAALANEAFVASVREHLTAMEDTLRASGVVNPGLLRQAGLHVVL
jgi:hypothetical protein